jgi:hypothetical protein
VCGLDSWLMTDFNAPPARIGLDVLAFSISFLIAV